MTTKTNKKLKKNSHSKWIWNNKEVELDRMSDSQLWSIKHTLLTSKNKWFGHHKDYWLNQINPILKKRELLNIEKLQEQIELRKKARAFKISEIIINELGKKQ
jgi:hypothetical protein